MATIEIKDDEIAVIIRSSGKHAAVYVGDKPIGLISSFQLTARMDEQALLTVLFPDTEGGELNALVLAYADAVRTAMPSAVVRIDPFAPIVSSTKNVR